MKFITKISLVLLSALAYYLIFYANKIIFESLEFSYGVNWIFIPSGIQLLLVLILIGEGALGIVLASFIIGLENYYLDSVIRTFITALISGIAPLISRKICFDFLGIEKRTAKHHYKIHNSNVHSLCFCQRLPASTMVLL
jgi:hypothetical protein